MEYFNAVGLIFGMLIGYFIILDIIRRRELKRQAFTKAREETNWGSPKSLPSEQSQESNLVARGAICTAGHDMVTSQVQLEGELKVVVVCASCGWMEGRSEQLSDEALATLNASFNQYVYQATKDRLLAKEVEFALSSFVDSWVAAHGEKLQECLNDTHQVEKLHTLLINLIAQGVQASASIKERVESSGVLPKRGMVGNA